MSLQKITADDLADAMLPWILLITRSGEGKTFRGVRKDLYFCPASGEFKITADKTKAQVVQTRADAIKAFNAIDLKEIS